MPPLDRPIPSFYACYLLRSTVRHSALYIGSTPNPVRRLRQHNGLAKGGAARTSRNFTRPWEMACIVTGFPSSIAALQFEWAWQNPHVTLHIPPSLRISHSSQKKRSGHPRRPRHTLQSTLSNLHLLLSVPSFSRWPLEMRFFAPDAYKAWIKWTKGLNETLRDSLPIITDFPPTKLKVDNEDGESTGGFHGIEALKIAYQDTKSHLEKGKIIFNSDIKGSCKVCNETVHQDSGLYTICTNTECNAICHMKCLGQHFLQSEKPGETPLVPIKGVCPSCKTEIRWKDVVTELSLRIRGPKLVEKLLQPKRAKKVKGAAVAQTIDDSEDDQEEDEEQGGETEEEENYINEDELSTQNAEENGFNHYLDSDNSDTVSIASIESNKSYKREKSSAAIKSELVPVIGDREMDDGEKSSR